jgi:phi LC3 family holin
MKLNFKVRAKNPYFWIGLVGVILAAMGVDASMFTSWGAVWDALVGLVTNPFMLGSVIIAVIGVLVDPTTKGIADSSQALTYDKPKVDE